MVYKPTYNWGAHPVYNTIIYIYNKSNIIFYDICTSIYLPLIIEVAHFCPQVSVVVTNVFFFVTVRDRQETQKVFELAAKKADDLVRKPSCGGVSLKIGFIPQMVSFIWTIRVLRMGFWMILGYPIFRQNQVIYGTL